MISCSCARACAPRSLIVAVALLVGVASIQAQTYKLNDPFARAPISASVTSVANSPDGLTFVYATSAGGLYSTRIGVHGAVRLNDGIHSASPFRISADGTQVVFYDFGGDLYVSPIDGSRRPLPLNIRPSLPIGGDVRDLVLTAEGDVLFTAPSRHVFGGAQYGLFRAAITRDAPITQLTPSVQGSGLIAFALVPGSRDVLFVSSANLYRVELAAGIAELIAPLSVSGGLQVSANGSRVAYTKFNGGLYSRPTGDGTEVQLFSSTVAFRITPAGDRVVYGLSSGLFSIPATGGSATQLVAQTGIAGFELSANGAQILYRTSGGTADLFRVPIGGGTPVKLNAGSSVQTFALTPDASRVVYSGLGAAPGVVELFSVPLAGGAVQHLNGPLIQGGNVQSFLVSNDSLGVAYLADAFQDGAVELFGVRIDGQASAVKLNGPLPRVSPADVSTFEISSDSRRAVYLADAAKDGVSELYSVPLDRRAGVVKLNGPLASGTQVRQIAASPDGARVVFQIGTVADQGPLFSVPIDGAGPALEITSLQALSFAITSDSERVVFTATYPFEELYSVPIDGSAPPVQLGSHVEDFLISADGARVVYLSSSSWDLFSVPSDGASAPVQLTDGALSGMQTVPNDSQGPGYALTADGSRVVYLALTGLASPVLLFSVPTDGSASPIELSGPLTGFRAVKSFYVGERVVYVADQDTATVDELYSVPDDGSASPVKLNQPLGAFARVSPLVTFTPDGRRVLFSVGLQPGLFCVPIDGSSAPIELPGTVNSFFATVFSPDGARVVFDSSDSSLWSVLLDGSASAVPISRATQHTNFPLGKVGASVIFEAGDAGDGSPGLFIAPIDGSTDPRRLDSYPGPSGDTMRVMRITPDGSRVLFITDDDRPGMFELFASFINGPTSMSHLQRAR